MKKTMILGFLILTGCSSKTINGKDQTFTEYVILNKNSEWQGKTWKELEPECFQLTRLGNWIKGE